MSKEDKIQNQMSQRPQEPLNSAASEPVAGIVFADHGYGTMGVGIQGGRCDGHTTHISVMKRPLKLKPWSTGLLNCLDDTCGCIEGYFLGTCQRSRQYNMLTNGSNSIHWPMCVLPFFLDIIFAVPLAQMGLACMLRREVRKRYHLEGGDFSDVAIVVCCSPCSTCQNYREMSAHGEWPGALCTDMQPPITECPMGAIRIEDRCHNTETIVYN
eukprot:Tbor_TRINITY_DN5356_c4_g2::TRINITY_DN5356_c4_g2_i1::g.4289::m.4289